MAQVLVVDDAEIIRAEVANLLRGQGYDVADAENGVKALEYLRQDPDVQLLLTDLNMPEMDGVTLVENVRNTLHNTDVKVLIVTTETSAELKQRCKPLKIMGWVIKPIQPNAFTTVVERLVH